MATEPVSFTAFIVAGFAATLSWAGGLTKLAYDNKSKIVVLDERTKKTDRCIVEVKETLVRQDEKLDRLIEHMLDQKER
jgi:hypothetical protein